jgi:hypothetical protein
MIEEHNNNEAPVEDTEILDRPAPKATKKKTTKKKTTPAPAPRVEEAKPKGVGVKGIIL